MRNHNKLPTRHSITQTNMESLPPELIVEICSHLSLKELKHARLVNKSFARLVTSRLFSSVAIWLQKESVEM